MGGSLTPHCWLPSQGNEVIIGEAEGALLSVPEAEEVYRTQHGHYAYLTDLGPAGAKLISQELAEGRTRRFYRLSIENPSKDAYVLTLFSRDQDNALACFLGCSMCLNFYADETRIVRYNSHCHAATSKSPVWPLPKQLRQ
jgi:hypothetical protein